MCLRWNRRRSWRFHSLMFQMSSCSLALNFDICLSCLDECSYFLNLTNVLEPVTSWHLCLRCEILEDCGVRQESIELFWLLEDFELGRVRMCKLMQLAVH